MQDLLPVSPCYTVLVTVLCCAGFFVRDKNTVRVEMSEHVTFGNFVKSRRGALGLSQEVVALRADIDRTYLNRIENGRIVNPRDVTRRRLLAGLELSDTEVAKWLDADREVKGLRAEVGISVKPEGTPLPLSIFCIYSHTDEGLLNELKEHLAPMRCQKKIGLWYDRLIRPGQEWQGEIDTRLDSADIIILLVSSSFMSSDYAYDREMMRALERHTSREAIVVPVIVRAVDWHSSPLGMLQAVPTDGKPVTRWADRDEAWLEVARGIRGVVDDVNLHLDEARRPSKHPEVIDEFPARSHPIDAPVEESDELGLLELVEDVQSAVVDIWTRLGRLDEVGTRFAHDSERDAAIAPVVYDGDPAATFAAARATFGRVAASLTWLSESIELENPGMKQAWERLGRAERLFSELLPIDSPDARRGAEGLLMGLPGLQAHFPGLISDLEKTRTTLLPQLRGISKELNQVVSRCDRAITETASTLSTGQTIAGRLALALESRLDKASTGE